MINRFHCPVQNPAAFSFAKCIVCRYYTCTRYLSGRVTMKCKKNKERWAANAWESAFLLASMGWEYHIEIIQEEEV